MAHEYQIGATEGAMELLPEAGIRASPRPGWRPYATAIELGDSTLRGQGYPIVTWHWASVLLTERAVFIAFLDEGALSGDVFIRTRLTDGTWATFQCVMNMPTGEEDAQSRSVLNFDIQFTHCILIPDYP